jgi:hypothetical protein
MVLLALSLITPSLAGMSGAHTLGKKVDHVVLQVIEGDIRVRVAADADRVVMETIDYRPGHTCAFDMSETRGRATISFGPKTLEEATDCRMDFTVTLSPGVRFSLELGRGRTRLTGIAADIDISVGEGDVELIDVGAVTLAVGAGDVSLRNVTGSMDIELGKGRLHGTPRGILAASVGEGHIELQELAAQVTAETGIGNILLGYQAVPNGILTLNAGMGNIVVDLPNDTEVLPQLTAASGTTRCALPTGSDVEIIAVAGMGSVLLH